MFEGVRERSNGVVVVVVRGVRRSSQCSLLCHHVVNVLYWRCCRRPLSLSLSLTHAHSLTFTHGHSLIHSLARSSKQHFRNYKKEGGRKNRLDLLGYLEATPSEIANTLFGHLRPNDKVAITTRYGPETVHAIVNALVARGLQVRVLTGQTRTEDFCFLLSTQKELVGSGMSTFLMWAAILGNATTVRPYVYDHPGTRKLMEAQFQHFDGTYNFTHPDLQRRFQFQLYPAPDGSIRPPSTTGTE